MQSFNKKKQCQINKLYFPLTGSAVITHDMTTGAGYCLVGFNWIIDFLN